MSTKKIGLDALLTPEESVLLLIDHQPFHSLRVRSVSLAGLSIQSR
jgi:hypothetical protein